MLSSWDSFAEMPRLEDEIARFFERSPQRTTNTPPVDIYEDAAALVIMAELPGVAREDLSIDLDNRVLTIRGERKPPSTDGAGFHRVERKHGAFARVFTLPDFVDPETIDANLEQGVLTLRLPKKAHAVPRRIEVKGV